MRRGKVCGTRVYPRTHARMTVHISRVCANVRPRGGLKPLRAVYTNAQTKEASFSQTGREIRLPERLGHLWPFKRRQILAGAEPKIAATLRRYTLSWSDCSSVSVTLSLLFVGNKYAFILKKKLVLKVFFIDHAGVYQADAQ